jgi:hypothetical protein
MCRQRAQMIIVRIETAGRFPLGTFDFGLGHAGGDCANHAGSYLILQLKDVLECSVISVCPQMSAGSCIDQLARDPDAISGFPDAPLENIPDPQILSHLLDIDSSALERETGVESDYEKLFVSRKGGSDFFDHSIGEVFLLRITAHVLEWQHRDGRFVREREGKFFRFCLGDFGAFASFFPHWPYETETLPRQRLDEALLLAGIADHVPGGIQAGRQRGIGYDTSVPDGVNKVVFANDVLPVADQVFEKVERLWRDGDDVRSAIQLAPVSVECVLLEEIAQAANSSGGLRSSGLQYQLQRKE